MNAWTDVSETISSTWAVFTRVEAKEDLKEAMTVSLEEVNKQWGRPYNWIVTLSNNGLMMQEKFYLNKDVWSHENAMNRADDLVKEYWNPKPVVAPARFVFGSQQALLKVQEKSSMMIEK